MPTSTNIVIGLDGHHEMHGLTDSNRWIYPSQTLHFERLASHTIRQW